MVFGLGGEVDIHNFFKMIYTTFLKWEVFVNRHFLLIFLITKNKNKSSVSYEYTFTFMDR